jgi:glycosyltransferase involved in cell wall biosynthesis
MKVLMVSEPGDNGVFRYVEALVSFLVEQDINVHLAYSDRRSSRQLPELVRFVEQHGGDTLNLGVSNRPAPADLGALRALHRLVRSVRPDIIHSHSSKGGALARLLPFCGIRARQIYHPHAYAGMRPQSRLGRTFFDAVEFALGHCGLTINASPDEQDYARLTLHLPATRTRCIPNGIDTRQFTPATPAAKRALRRARGLPVDALILGTLGRASPQKDPLTLYQAFVLALERQPHLLLYHLGRGELDAQLDEFIRRQRMQGRIIRQAHDDFPVDFYRCLDGFALTSVYEGFSLAAIEAMSCDLPLILSNAPGNHTLLELPLSHLTAAPPGDVVGFTLAINQWAAVRRHAGGWASNHRATAIREFDSRCNFQRVLEIYRSLLASGPLALGAPPREQNGIPPRRPAHRRKDHPTPSPN